MARALGAAFLVVVDVGAHTLLATRHFLREDDAVGILAIEPLSEPWTAWPPAPKHHGRPRGHQPRTRHGHGRPLLSLNSLAPSGP